MNQLKPLIALTAVALLSANCGRLQDVSTQANAEFLEAAPEVDALTLDDSDVTATRALDGATRDLVQKDMNTLSSGAIRELNDKIKAIVGQIQNLVANNPATVTADVHVWTKDKDGLSYRFSIKRLAAGAFGWTLEAKKDTEDESAYAKIMGGRFRKGYAARRGAGELGIDLSTYNDIAEGTAAAITAEGKILMAFRHVQAGSHLIVRLKGYSPDGVKDPVDLAFEGRRLHKKTRPNGSEIPALFFARAAGIADVFDDTSAQEKFAARLRRVVGVGGWARAVVFGGDVPADKVRVVRECWNRDAEVAYRRVWECAKPSQGLPPKDNCVLMGSLSKPQAEDDIVLADLTQDNTLRTKCFGPNGTLRSAAFAAAESAGDESDPAPNLDSDEEEPIPGVDAEQTSGDEVDASGEATVPSDIPADE